MWNWQQKCKRIFKKEQVSGRWRKPKFCHDKVSSWLYLPRGYGWRTLALWSLLARDRLNPYRNHVACVHMFFTKTEACIDTVHWQKGFSEPEWNSMDWSYSFSWCGPPGRMSLGRGEAGKTGSGGLCSCFCRTDVPQALFLGGSLSFCLSTVKAISKHASLQT